MAVQQGSEIVPENDQDLNFFPNGFRRLSTAVKGLKAHPMSISSHAWNKYILRAFPSDFKSSNER